MKVTAKLALCQIKLHRKRTIGAVFAIALSTGIVTALMCFATSANHMLVGFLGEDYGEYGATYSVLLAIPAFFLSLLIAFISISCISNIFLASANKRIQDFGIIKCVGGTKKQIKEIVLFESLWLSAVGIPLGLLAGTLIGFIGVSITSHYVSEFNEISKSIIMRPFEVSLDFYVSGWTYLLAAAASTVIILRSAGKPANTVGKITAIQCIKGLGADHGLKNRKIHSTLIEKIFGYEGTMGLTNINRNKTGYKTVIRSLALGLTLLIMLGGFVSQANDFSKWMNPDSKEMMVDFCSARDYEIMSNGVKKETYMVPIEAKTYNEIRDRLNEFDENEVYGIGNDSITYKGKIEDAFLSDSFLKLDGLTDEMGLRKVSLEATDDVLYEKLCKRAGAEIGSNLIINTFGYNDNGVWKTMEPYSDAIDKVLLRNAEGEETEIKIGGILHADDLQEMGFRDLVPDSIRIVVPGVTARFFDWYCNTEKEMDFINYARKVMDEYYPILTEDSYVEQGYTVRISRVDNMVKALNMAIVLGEFVMYGFVVLLMIIGFTSVINTLLTNIRIRSREFAVLKSVGMTNRALRKMVYSESIICLIRAIVPGVLFGLLIPYAVNLAIRQTFPILFHVPFFIMILGVVLVTAVVMVITFLEMSKLKDRSIIEEIRMDVM